jgi:hypothetical protein
MLTKHPRMTTAHTPAGPQAEQVRHRGRAIGDGTQTRHHTHSLHTWLIPSRSASSKQRSTRKKAGKSPSRSSSTPVRSPPGTLQGHTLATQLLTWGIRQDSSGCEHSRVVQHRGEGLHRVHGLQGPHSRSPKRPNLLTACSAQGIRRSLK